MIYQDLGDKTHALMYYKNGLTVAEKLRYFSYVKQFKRKIDML
jgi:hypothetical protein